MNIHEEPGGAGTTLHCVFFFFLHCGFTVSSICIIPLEALYISTVFTDKVVIARPVNPPSPLKCILRQTASQAVKPCFHTFCLSLPDGGGEKHGNWMCVSVSVGRQRFSS